MWAPHVRGSIVSNGRDRNNQASVDRIEDLESDHEGIFSSHNKEGHPAICDCVDGP